VAEEKRADGKALLTAFVAGCEGHVTDRCRLREIPSSEEVSTRQD
jgi:hypothetical protein